MSDVSLVDLEVIKRYSLAIRQETAPADEVLAVLEASRAQILAALEGRPMRAQPRRQVRQAYPELSDDRDADEDDEELDRELDLDLDDGFDAQFDGPPDDERLADPPNAPRERGRRRRAAPDPPERPVFAPRPWPSD